mgnify:FL=1
MHLVEVRVKRDHRWGIMSSTYIFKCLKQKAHLFLLKPALSAVCAVLVLLLAGCSTTVETVTKVAEVIYDPDIQVGSNEMQPSELSISALTVNADTTVSNTKKRSFFSPKVRKGYFLFQLYQVSNKTLAKSEKGILNANQVISVMQGKYLAKHQFYLKSNGYRFIKHFKVDREVGALLALVHFEEPQCSVWSTLTVVKNIGEEYNFFLKANERSFIFKSELDVSAPGEPIKVDNRFLGACKEQINASKAQVIEIEEDQDILEAIEQHQMNPSLSISSSDVHENGKGYKEQLITPSKDSNVLMAKTKSSKDFLSVATVAATSKKAVVIEDFKVDRKNTRPTEEATLSNNRASKVKGRTTGKEDAPLKTTNDVIEALVKKKIHSLVLTPAQLAVLPKYKNDQGNLVYFVTGVGNVKTVNESLNIRQAPGIESPRVATIRNKKSVQVQQYTPDLNGWLYIESEGVKPGWVSEPFVDWKTL